MGGRKKRVGGVGKGLVCFSYFFVFFGLFFFFFWGGGEGGFLFFWGFVFLVFFSYQGLQRVPCCLEVFQYFPGLPKSIPL